MIERKEWGAVVPKNVTALGKKFGYSLHWEGGHTGIFEHALCAGKVRNIQVFHMTVRGWADIAYNWVVCPHGEVFVGRGAGVRSAANGTNESNEHYEAICYLGGDWDEFTKAAQSTIEELVGGALLRPHSDFFNTECPGDAIRSWISSHQTGEDSIEMKTAEDVVSTARWPGGGGVRLLRNGSVRAYGKAVFLGSINDIPAEQKKNWSDGDGFIEPINDDPTKGYRVFDWDANMVAEFTPEWWAAHNAR